jgi:hypothetical protein
MSQNIIDAFVDKHGAIEDWDGDRSAWYQALGAFTFGWLARQDWEENSINDAIRKITEWKDKAYPLNAFPEPDPKRAREILQAGGMTLDDVSASNIRFALKRVCEMLDEAMKSQ